MKDLLSEANKERNKLIPQGKSAFSEEQLNRYYTLYDHILEIRFKENENTPGKCTRKEEKALLNRLRDDKHNDLLFPSDFQVHFSDNMSKKDLRICKNRQKMAGKFRTAEGRTMYCNILNFVETIKRRELNISQNIIKVISGQPVLA